MNKTLSAISLFVLIGSSIQAQNLSKEKQLILNHTVDSLLDNYEKYSCLTSNTTSFSDKYATSLYELFQDKASSNVANDLPLFPDKESFKLSDYVEAVKTQIPTGLDVILRNVQKKDPVFADGKYLIELTFEKNILGIFQGTQRFDQIVMLASELILSEDLKSGKFKTLQRVPASKKPENPGLINGRTNVSASQTGVFYAVNAQNNARYYTWKLPQGWNGKSSMNTIFVDLSNSAKSGDILVSAHNEKGESEASSLYVEVAKNEGVMGEETLSTMQQSRLSVAGDVGVMSASSSVSSNNEALSFEGRAWLIYQFSDLGKGLFFNGKLGLGGAYYGFALENADKSVSDIYMTSIEIPLMPGLEKKLGDKFSVSVFSGAAFNLPIANSNRLKAPGPVSWLSDLDITYKLNIWGGYTSLYAGVRYNQLFGFKTDGSATNVAAMGVHGGIKINTGFIHKP